MSATTPLESLSPVDTSDTGSTHTTVAKGVGLCLSGGGYRAMLFHLGSLLRLLEFDFFSSKDISGNSGNYGELKRISSVSGGSITSAVLAQSWDEVAYDQPGARDRYLNLVVKSVCDLAAHTIDIPSVLTGLLPFNSASKRIAAAYRKYLFGDNTLSTFPDEPRFVINATNLQSGVLWRFMKPYTRDWKVGEIPATRKKIQTATAVAASSAFPPFLSPAKLKFEPDDFTPNSGGSGSNNLQKPPFTTKPTLSDGGVYDNLGLETVWKRYKTVLVSDAGGEMSSKSKVAANWPQQAYRVLNVIDNQVRCLRKRQTIDSFIAGIRTGAYWGIRTDISHYELHDSLPCPYAKTLKLANTPTRLKKLDDTLQKRLINWGYAVCDAAIRAHVDHTLSPPTDFPYPAEGVG